MMIRVGGVCMCVCACVDNPAFQLGFDLSGLCSHLFLFHAAAGSIITTHPKLFVRRLDLTVSLGDFNT